MHRNDDGDFEFYAAGELIDKIDEKDAVEDAEALAERLKAEATPNDGDDPEGDPDEGLTASELVERRRRQLERMRIEVEDQ